MIPQVTYTELDKGWSADLSSKREYVRQLANDLGMKVNGTTDDLVVIQIIIHAKLIKENETSKLQSLGVAFGDIIAKNYPA